jgi:hypothetical protein
VNEQGRCAGCKLTDGRKKVDQHVLRCADYARLYREEPDRALTPAQEYLRWRRDEYAAEHAADLAGRVADTQDRRARSVSRFEVPDLLE